MARQGPPRKSHAGAAFLRGRRGGGRGKALLREQPARLGEAGSLEARAAATDSSQRGEVEPTELGARGLEALDGSPEELLVMESPVVGDGMGEQELDQRLGPL